MREELKEEIFDRVKMTVLVGGSAAFTALAVAGGVGRVAVQRTHGVTSSYLIDLDSAIGFAGTYGLGIIGLGVAAGAVWDGARYIKSRKE